MIEYNIEKYKPTSKKVNGLDKYFCVIRKSFVPKTPEEKVRQAFINFLIFEKEFPIEKIRVEVSLAQYQKGNKKRADILILDDFNIPIIIYECKKENERLLDEVILQGVDYFETINNLQYLGFVLGGFVKTGFLKIENEIFDFEILTKHPNYNTMISKGNINIELPEKIDYIRNEWKKPKNKKALIQLLEFGIIGEGTNEKYLPFLINLDGWLMDTEDIFHAKNIDDIGIKFTKFGSAGGGYFPLEYRSFLLKNKIDKPIICISIVGIRSSLNVKAGTCIYVGIETIHEKHSTLQLRIGSSVIINENIAEIWHNGSITIGKLGAAKRQELIDYVKVKNSHLIKNNKIYLGSLNFNDKIESSQEATIDFIENIIEYSLIRDDFRKDKKAIAREILQ